MEDFCGHTSDSQVEVRDSGRDLDGRGETPYETEERDDLCAYIDETLEEVGIDLDAIAARAGISRYEFTDQWREW